MIIGHVKRKEAALAESGEEEGVKKSYDCEAGSDFLSISR